MSIEGPGYSEYSVDPRAAIGDPSAEILRISAYPESTQSLDGGGEYAVAERQPDGSVTLGTPFKIPFQEPAPQDTPW